MHNFLVCAYKSQDFAQNLKKFAQSHDRESVTFRNSELLLVLWFVGCSSSDKKVV